MKPRTSSFSKHTLQHALWVAASVATAAVAQVPDHAPAIRIEGDEEMRPASITVDEVSVGQQGYGLSVFEGNEVERFGVEVVGVMRDAHPGVSFVLARLSGRGLEETGVIAGMSGSPVYLEDRLLGAVAFSWNFSKGAIAGITPIDAMRNLSTSDLQLPPSWAPGGATGRVALPTQPGRGAAALLAGLVDLPSREAASTDSPTYSLEELLLPTRPTRWLKTALETLRGRPSWVSDVSDDPTASTLQFSATGFSGAGRRFLGETLGAVAPAGRTDVGAAAELQPGAAVAGVLIDGDLQLAVSGTVTERFQDEVLAFGHPYLGVGPLHLPMAPAEVVTVISSQASSFKITNVGPVIGAFREDRLAGIRGVIGEAPRTVPIRVTVGGSHPHEFRMKLADLPQMAPTLVAVSVLEALDGANQMNGEGGLDLEARFEIAGQDDLVIRQTFDGSSVGVEGAIYLLSLTGFLVFNPYEAVAVKAIDIEAVPSPSPRVATIVSVHPERTEVRPGETIKLWLQLRAYRGERFEHALEVEVPEDQPPGPFYLFVGDGPTIDTVELQLEPGEPQDLKSALARLRSFRAQDQLVVLSAMPAPGLLVDGVAMPRLPASIRALWQGASQPSTRALSLALLSSESRQFATPLSGGARVDLKVLPKRGTETAR